MKIRKEPGERGIIVKITIKVALEEEREVEDQEREPVY